MKKILIIIVVLIVLGFSAAVYYWNGGYVGNSLKTFQLSQNGQTLLTAEYPSQYSGGQPYNYSYVLTSRYSFACYDKNVFITTSIIPQRETKDEYVAKLTRFATLEKYSQPTQIDINGTTYIVDHTGGTSYTAFRNGYMINLRYTPTACVSQKGINVDADVIEILKSIKFSGPLAG